MDSVLVDGQRGMFVSEFASLQLREATKADQAAVVDLIDRVYREYGEKICLEDADSDLLDLEGNYLRKGGCFVVLEGPQGIVGSHAVLPIDLDTGLCTFRRLYLVPELRGSGTGVELMTWAIDWAKQAGLRRVEFWSDTRFERAHRFFERLGFIKNGRVREMDDGHDPYREFFFYRELEATGDQ